MELHAEHGKFTQLGFDGIGWWARDYPALLKQFVSEEQIRVTKIPEDIWPASPWKEFGHIIEVDLKV